MWGQFRFPTSCLIKQQITDITATSERLVFNPGMRKAFLRMTRSRNSEEKINKGMDNENISDLGYKTFP